MNPIAPVSMLIGKGSGTAILVVAALVGLALFANQRSPVSKPKN